MNPIELLRPIFKERVTESRAARAQHSKDLSYLPAAAPDVVVYAETREEIQALAKVCSEHRIPIIPFGAGTSVEGHILAVHGGVTVDLSRMNKVLRLNADDADVTVQAGTTREQLNTYLRDTGLMFPIDPGANATLGGMVATRASGTNAVRYGTMKDNTLALEVVLADGRVIHTARRARKSSAGYDLTRLFVGSEGTLGIITEVTVRLYGQPAAIGSGTCAFETLGEACACVIETMQMGIPIARIELMDETAIQAVNQYAALGLEVKPTLFVEFHGTAASVDEQSQAFAAIVNEHGGTSVRFAQSPEARSSLWRARHRAALAVSAFAAGTSQWWTDVCVPISRLADCITQTQADISASGLTAPILGHVGDGNFHVGICFNPDDADQSKRAESLHHRLMERALEAEGTCTGEHGIGLGKIDYLQRELTDAVAIMRDIKLALDPRNIMNPGKVLRI